MPWTTQFQDAEDYYAGLKRYGFSLVWAREQVFVTVAFPNTEAFLTSKLAWATRRLRLEALAEEQRRACLDEMRAGLRQTLGLQPDDTFLWKPPLIRVCAVR